jgi:hypothetical protein
MRRRWRSVVVGSLALSAAVWACSSFSCNGSPADIADTGDAAPDADVGSPVDAGVPDDADAAPPGDACTMPPPAPTTVAVTDAGPTLVASDGFYVYWAGAGRVERVSLAAGATVELADLPASAVAGLVLTSTSLVFERGSGIGARPKMAPLATPLVDYGAGWSGLLAGGDVVDLAVAGGPAAIWVLSPPTPAPGGARRLTVLASAPVAASISGNVVAFVGARVGMGNELLVIPANASDGTPVPLQTSGRNASRVATDGTTVYFTTDKGSVSAVAVDGGAASDLALNQPTPLGDIAVTNDFVVFVTPNGIQRVAKTGSCVVALSTGTATSIAVAGTNVYWVDDVHVYSAPLR